MSEARKSLNSPPVREPSPPQTFLGYRLPRADEWNGMTFNVPLPEGTVVEGDLIYRPPFKLSDVAATTMPDPVLPRIVLTKRRWRTRTSEWTLWCLDDIPVLVGT